MRTQKLNIQEIDFELGNTSSMVFNLIDNQINYYKRQFLVDWEKNHKISLVEKEEKISALEAKKEEIKSLLMEYQNGDALADLSINIDIAIKD